VKAVVGRVEQTERIGAEDRQTVIELGMGHFISATLDAIEKSPT
jgi:hypothetical protein